MSNIELFRDAQAALDMGKKAMLGYFDIEFTMYGTAYLFDGEMSYRISDEDDQIYHFMETAAAKDIFCANICQYSKRYKVPSGTKEEKELLIKYITARQLQQLYPKELFEQLSSIADIAKENIAYSMLKQEQELLEGLFEADELRYYEELVQHCYDVFALDKNSYQELRRWIVEERRNIEEDYIEKDIFEKTFYGIAYKTDNGYKYISDGLRKNMYRKKYVLQQDATILSPIFSQTYWYNYTYRLSDAKQDYLKRFKKVIDIDYMQKIEQISVKNQYASKIDGLGMITQAEKEMGRAAAKTLQRYLYTWRLL